MSVIGEALNCVDEDQPVYLKSQLTTMTTLSWSQAAETFTAPMRNHLTGARLRLISSRARIAGKHSHIYHYRIRKTGGPSLNSAFWDLVGLDLRQFEARKRVRQGG
jgi:hypothetical protein